MSKNLWFALVGFVVLVVCTGFYFSPHLAVHNMKKAAEAKDADALSSYVDFPSLRESLNANFNAKMVSEVAKSKSGDPFEALGAAIATALINPMIDALVTPESLAILTKGEKPEMSQSGNESKIQSAPERANTETSMSYKGLNRFIVRVKEKDSTEEPIEFIFKRDGIISWKLSGLRIK